MRAGELSRAVAKQLEKVSECADFEAKCLLEHFLSLSLNDIYLDKELGNIDTSELESAVDKRLQNYPLQYILGKWEFMGNEFFVDENVLIPRPETELLCECLADRINQNSVVYDLCSGTGCVAVSLSKITGAKVYALEKYEGALSVLDKNVALNGVKNVFPVKWDITEKPDSSFEKADFILSNPPYIESETVSKLQKEVLAEPHTALDGGQDGFEFYKAINSNFKDLLKEGGYAAFEIGEGQERGLLEIFSSLNHIKTIKDFNGIKRVVIFRKGN